jgi:alanine dehydrogenase
MLLLKDQDVAHVLDELSAIDALRASYLAFSKGDAALAPRIDLYAPTTAAADAYRCGSMAGVCLSAGVAAFRIKSDIVTWQDGVESKYCGRPGLYSGIILLYALTDGKPLAILQDGTLQHIRVGAAMALGIEALADPAADHVALIGSGGMAWSCLKAATHVRSIRHVSLYSRSRENRTRFADRISAELGISVTVCTTARDAVVGSPLVVSATSSLSPTISCDWLDEGAHVAFVSRREIPSDLHERMATVYRLGEASLPPDVPVPRADWYRGGFVGFAAGPPAFRQALPKYRGGRTPRERNLVDEYAALDSAYTGATTSLICVGTQGLQFAAVGAVALRLARAAALGFEIDDSWFLQTVRN